MRHSVGGGSLWGVQWGAVSMERSVGGTLWGVQWGGGG